MLYYADFHLHSKYARATSINMDLEHITQGARAKGVNIVGTGDFSHPTWFSELKKKLVESDAPGFYELKNAPAGARAKEKKILFALTNEVSTIISTRKGVKKVHHVIHAPSLEEVTQLNDVYAKLGNLAADGRPTFGKCSPAEIVEKTREAVKNAVMIPAHAYTPWFSVFGDMSGFNSLDEAFEEQAKNIFAIETGMSCYDEETEVLTKNGWKKFADVTYSNEICTLNPKTDKIEFQRPSKVFRYRYKGKMYRLKTKRIDLLVTPNHKLFITTCDFRNPKPFFLKEAEFLFGKSKQFKKDGVWDGKVEEYFVLPAVKVRHGSRFYSGVRGKSSKKIPMRDWLKFFGFWIAEGWVTEGKNGDYGVYVCNKNEKLINEMKQLLEGFGHKPSYSQKNFTMRVRDFQLFHYLKQFGKCRDKFIPSDVKNLSPSLLQTLLDYYIKGDGHIYGRTRKGLSATTTSIKLRDDLQEIALKVGMSAYFKLGYKKGTPFISPKQKKVYLQKSDTWIIYFIRKNKHAVVPSTVKKYGHVEQWTYYDGLVYCISVPNHVIYVRRNGIPVWCGNSDPAMNWRISALDKIALVSNSDSHSYHPWRIGRECNAFEFFEKELSFESVFKAVREKDARHFKFTVEVDPNYGKYHYDGHRLCKFSCSPEETKKLKNICPVCKRKLTIGVLNRIEALADRPEGFVPKNAIPFKTLLPLHELLAAAFASTLASKRVMEVGDRLIHEFGSEFGVLLNATREELLKHTQDKIADVIIANREGKLKVKPGYDGEYGVLMLNGEKTVEKKDDETQRKQPKKQKTLDDY